ncbi:MAG TPA: transcriptional regulator [Candidatus Thermoplasmatota archaeon]|nr:transcriptional regulator [Candidatus Thermoplasmatota archaeon]
MRANLLSSVREILTKAGFYLSVDAALRPLAFDIVARRDSQLLIVKVLTNVDGLSEPVANELRTIAQFLDAAPLVVGERSSSRPLEDGAVYLRYGVRIVTLETLREFLEDGVEPLVYAAPGGFYVNLDGERMRQIREERGLSLGDLAQAAGVSRRAIGMYEEGMGAMVEVAQRLEEFLDEALVVPYHAFEPPAPEPTPAPTAITDVGSAFQAAVLESLQRLGFRVAPTQRSPFSAITREHLDTTHADGRARVITERVVLTGFAADDPDAAKRAAATANLAEVTESFGVFFVERKTTRTVLEGTPVLSREELKKVDDADALLKLLGERRPRQRQG